MNEIQYFKGWIPAYTKQLDKDGKVYTPEFVKHYKQKGRPAYLSKVLVLTKNGDVTLAIYGKYTSLSNPSFIACHNGGHIELDVKHWMDWFDDVGSMLHDDFYKSI
jgi:hypothetical protein